MIDPSERERLQVANLRLDRARAELGQAQRTVVMWNQVASDLLEQILVLRRQIYAIEREAQE